MIRYLFENYGNSPAIIRQIRVDFMLDPNPPSAEIGDHIALPANRVVPPQKSTGHWEAGLATQPNESTVSALNDQKTFFWFYGTVDFDDIFGAEYVTEFCLRFDAKQNYLAPYDGDRKRNKCTRNTQDSAGLSEPP